MPLIRNQNVIQKPILSLLLAYRMDLSRPKRRLYQLRVDGFVPSNSTAMSSTISSGDGVNKLQRSRHDIRALTLQFSLILFSYFPRSLNECPNRWFENLIKKKTYGWTNLSFCWSIHFLMDNEMNEFIWQKIIAVIRILFVGKKSSNRSHTSSIDYGIRAMAYVF